MKKIFSAAVSWWNLKFSQRDKNGAEVTHTSVYAPSKE